MASFSSGLNPNVVKTELDDVFYPAFDGRLSPAIATAETPDVFNQLTTEQAAEQWEVFAGVGSWELRQEEQDLPQGTPRIGNKITFNVVEFAKSVDIPKHFFDDAKHNAVNKMVADLGRTGRTTRDQNAFNIYNGAFTTTLVADGSSLISASHTTLKGFTVDNSIAGALTPTTLNTAILSLVKQQAQDGTLGGHMPVALLVAVDNFKNASEILDSELESDTSDNAINVYSSKYAIRLFQTPHMSAAFGGSDTAWFLLSDNHSVNRWVREAVQTLLVPFETQRNNNYIYKAWFREVVGAVSFEGIVGSTGV